LNLRLRQSSCSWSRSARSKTAAIFGVLTTGARRAARRRLAVEAVVIAGVVLVVFAIGGTDFLRLLHVSIPAFQVAAGILLLLQSIELLFAHPSGLSALTASEEKEARATGEIAVFPLAIPLIAARKALRKILTGLGRISVDRSFEIHSGRDLYLTGGRFDRAKVKATWNTKLAHALAEGYEGLRVVGDAFWLDESAWKDFYEYEMELNQSIAGRQISVLCAYPLDVTGAADIFDVARAHQCAVAKRNRDWEVGETPALKQAKEEITRLNEELERRVIQRTAQLTAANAELRAVIAERMRAEAALHEAQAELARTERVTTMGEMAAAIAHETNQPLAAIITEE